MRDFCYSRPMLNRVLQHAELMDRMMERLGVDPAAAARLENGMAWYGHAVNASPAQVSANVRSG